MPALDPTLARFAIGVMLAIIILLLALLAPPAPIDLDDEEEGW